MCPSSKIWTCPAMHNNATDERHGVNMALCFSSNACLQCDTGLIYMFCKVLIHFAFQHDYPFWQGEFKYVWWNWNTQKCYVINIKEMFLVLTISIYVYGRPGNLWYSGYHPLQQEDEQGDAVTADLCFHLASRFSLSSTYNRTQENKLSSY